MHADEPPDDAHYAAASTIPRHPRHRPTRGTPRMPKTVILSTARTPFGKMGGALAPLGAPELGGKAIGSALERASVEPGQVESVVYGQVLQAGQGQIPSRQAQIAGGIPQEGPSGKANQVGA